MAKNQNELCVSIPTYFRCPISLDLMKSPVSLSTGITYDRSSIQSWLDNGNTTCPATMQSLSSPSFVPNLTLHRLIHLWSHSHSLSSPPFHLPSLLTNPRDLNFSLKNVLDQATKSEENRRVLVDSDEFLSSIVELMIKSDEVQIEVLELILLILNLCEGDKLVKLMNSNCFTKFVVVLRNGCVESKIAAARIIHKVVIDKEVKGLLIETPNLFLELYNMIKLGSDSSIEAGLSALIGIASSKTAKMEVVRLGMVRRIGEILCDAGRTTDVMVIQRSMEMLEMMATFTEGRTAICEEENCVVEIVRKLMKVSGKTTEHGVTVLWSVCYLFRDEKVKEILGRNNGLGKCLLLLQSDCSPIVKQMCCDLVKVLRVNYNKSCLGVYDTKTTHIMPY